MHQTLHCAHVIELPHQSLWPVHIETEQSFHHMLPLLSFQFPQSEPELLFQSLFLLSQFELLFQLLLELLSQLLLRSPLQPQLSADHEPLSWLSPVEAEACAGIAKESESMNATATAIAPAICKMFVFCRYVMFICSYVVVTVNVFDL
jgi:hypothetical protein